MSKFLDGNEPKKSSSLCQLLINLDNRFLTKDTILVHGPQISHIDIQDDHAIIKEGCYNIIHGLTKGLIIDIQSNPYKIDERTYLQFRTGNEVGVGLQFKNQISYLLGDEFVLGTNKLYIIKLTPNPINKGYLMEWMMQ